MLFRQGSGQSVHGRPHRDHRSGIQRHRGCRELVTTSAAGVSEILLIERAADIGRGAAYAVHAFPYLLNVPASRLSADSAARCSFWILRDGRCRTPDLRIFLPRQLYGDYLQEFLTEAERAATHGTRLTRVRAEVTTLSHRRQADAIVVELRAREPLTARWVILATGTPPPPRRCGPAGFANIRPIATTPSTCPPT